VHRAHRRQRASKIQHISSIIRGTWLTSTSTLRQPLGPGRPRRGRIPPCHHHHGPASLNPAARTRGA
jgi:hypothetical protein